jgi:hypothetical protein
VQDEGLDYSFAAFWPREDRARYVVDDSAARVALHLRAREVVFVFEYQHIVILCVLCAHPSANVWIFCDRLRSRYVQDPARDAFGFS